MASSGRRFHETYEGAWRSLEIPPIWEAPYLLLSQQYPPKVAAVVVPRHLQLVQSWSPLNQFLHEVHALDVPRHLQLVQGSSLLNQFPQEVDALVVLRHLKLAQGSSFLNQFT